jgi:hypothetical protein
MREPPFRPRASYITEGSIEWRRESARRSPPPLPPRWGDEPPSQPTDARSPQRERDRLHVAPPSAPEFIPAYQTSPLISLTGEELLKRQFPAREMLLAPWLPQKGLTMIFAERGIGKTWTGLNIAHAAAGGGAFLRWRALRPCRVVYVDGEMPAGALKDRYAAVVAEADFDAPADHFRLVAADLQPDGLPDLADPAAQKFYDAAIAEVL